MLTKTGSLDKKISIKINRLILIYFQYTVLKTVYFFIPLINEKMLKI